MTTKKKPTSQQINKLHARVNSESPPASPAVHQQYQDALQASMPKVKRSKKPGESKIVPQ